jgi:hypothetical protein
MKDTEHHHLSLSEKQGCSSLKLGLSMVAALQTETCHGSHLCDVKILSLP